LPRLSSPAPRQSGDPPTRLFAIASGVAVANLYYVQPLLAVIARDFDLTAATASLLLFCSQIGYAAGILLFVPLGDVRDRRRLVPSMMGIAGAALLLCALAPSFDLLLVSIFLVGLTTVSGQILVAFTADLSAEGSRGRALGTVVSGLLTGILSARAASGLIADALGWRAVFAIATALDLFLAVLIWRRAPRSSPRPGAGYGALLRSVPTLVRGTPLLRRAMAFGFVSMASFNLFWTGATLLLSSPHYHFRPGEIGALSALGLVGTMVTRRAGRLHDSGRSTLASTAAWAVMLSGWLACIPAGSSLGWLIAAVLVIDVGTQGQRILNQTRALTLSPSARSRANTAYMSSNFVGAATGSLAAMILWRAGGWTAVAATGSSMCLLALGARLVGEHGRTAMRCRLFGKTAPGQELHLPERNDH
jgi:predicted MFS family arabinose efflux permease